MSEMDDDPDTVTWEREVPLGKDRDEALRLLTGEMVEYAMNIWNLAPFDLTQSADSNTISVTVTLVRTQLVRPDREGLSR